MDTAHGDDGGSGQGGGRRGGIVLNTRRMPGATEKLGDGDSVGKQAGNGSNNGLTCAADGIGAPEGESGRSEGDRASSWDAPGTTVPAARSETTFGWVVGAQAAANVLQAVGWCVLCTGHGTNRDATHGREGSDTTALR